MFKKSRTIVAAGLAVAVGTVGVAVAGDPTAAQLNAAKVDGKISPRKLPVKKFKRAKLFSGVRNSLYTSGTDDTQNPASEFLSYSKNIRVSLRGIPKCPQLPNGIPTQEARDTCPAGSFLGGGKATVRNPNDPSSPPPDGKFDQVVSVFHGPDQNELQLHTYGELGGLSPVVAGKIVKAPGKKWGQALSVPNAPETGTLLITSFNATLKKGAKARCKPRKFQFKRTVTYKDGSKETVTKSQRCKPRR